MNFSISLVGFLGTSFSWWVLPRIKRASDARKNSLLELTALKDAACKFWSKDATFLKDRLALGQELQIKINALSRDVRARCKGYYFYDVDLDRLNQTIGKLRRVITGQNFLDLSRKANLDQVAKIRSAVIEAESILDAGFDPFPFGRMVKDLRAFIESFFHNK